MTPDDAFIADIIANPEDDTPRLIYADWLEEHGQHERAEFIRLQIAKGDLPYRLQYRIDKHGWRSLFGIRQALDPWITTHRERTGQYPGYSWGSCESPTGSGLYKCGAGEVWIEQKPLFKIVARRGFVAEITCALADWCGEACPGRCRQECKGERTRAFYRHFDYGDVQRWEQCSICSGTGRVGGHGPALVRACPLERVTLSDREPDESDLVSWSSHPQGETLGDADELPWGLFLLLPGEATDLLSDRRREELYRQGRVGSWRWKCYDTKALALDALSHACLSLFSQRALTKEGSMP